MNQENQPARLWGLGLIVVAILLTVVGYLGARITDNRLNKIQYEFWATEQHQLSQIWTLNFSQMEQNLSQLGSQDFKIESASAAGVQIGVSEELSEMMETIVQATEIDIKSAYPDYDYIITVQILFTGATRAIDIEGPEWYSMSQDLPSEAINNPQAYISGYSKGGGSSKTISFLIPEGYSGADNQLARDVLYNYDSPLTRVDFAGNEFPIGIAGLAVLRINLQEQPMPAGIMKILATILSRAGLLGLLLLFISPPIWVYLDAKKRRLPAALWGLFALPTSFLGALIYALVTRDAGPACPDCGERVTGRFVVCPYCQSELKGTCTTCGLTVGLNWNYCPSCSTEL